MHQIFYITPNPARALGVEDIIPSFHIIHSDISQLTVPISNQGIDIQNFPILVSNGESRTLQLLQDEKVQNYIKGFAHGTPDILVSHNEKKIETLVKELGFNLLNAPADISNSLLEQSALDRFLQENDVFPQSTNGSEDKIVYKVTCCVTRLGIIVGGISEEIRNIALLSNSKEKALGHDFSQRHLNDFLRAELVAKSTVLGNSLVKEGYRGIFSIDLEFNKETNTFYLLKINLYQDSSVNFLSFLQKHNHRVPLMLWHALELLNHNYYEKFNSLDEEMEEWINAEIERFRLSEDKLSYNIENNQPINASQIIFRNTKEFDVKVLDQFPAGIFRIRGRLPDDAAALENEDSYPAVYRMRENGYSTLCLIRRGYNILEAVAEDGFLINCAPENSIVVVDGEIGRIQFMESAFSSKDTDDLNGWITDTVATIYENIRVIQA